MEESQPSQENQPTEKKVKTNCILSVKFTPSQWEYIETVSETVGLSKNALIRSAINHLKRLKTIKLKP